MKSKETKFLVNINMKRIISQSLLLPLSLICSSTLLFAQESDKEGSRQPNILFCIADDASFQHMSAYGMTDWVSTPAFDRVAKNGLLFTNTYTPNAKCAPSRASILTGRNSWQLEEAGNHHSFFPAKFTTFMEALPKKGYEVGYTGKGWAPGEPGKIDGKRRELTGKEYSSIKTEAPTSAISSIDYTANFEEFLRNKPQDKPFYFWYGGYEPHRSYEYGSGVAKGNKKLSDIDNIPPYWIDNEQVRNDMLDYAYEIEYFDHHLGKMLEVLEKKGELENTIIVVTSDNGMPFPRVKGHMYEFDNHLPLAIMWKEGITNPGRKIEDFISFIDFAPTFLEIAGLEEEDSNMQPIEGKSFFDIISSKSGNLIDPTRNHVLLGRERQDVGRPGDVGYPVRGIVKENFIYTKNYEPSRWPAGNPETGYLDTDGSPTKTAILEAHKTGEYTLPWELAFGKRGSEELYQIDKDFHAMVNLAEDPAFAVQKNKLKTQMEQELKEQQDPRMFGKGYIFDEYPYSNPEHRNFYERHMKGEKIHTGWVNDSDFEPVEEQD